MLYASGEQLPKIFEMSLDFCTDPSVPNTLAIGIGIIIIILQYRIMWNEEA